MSDTQAIKAYVRVRPFTAKEMTLRPQPCIRPNGNRILVEHEVVAQAEIESGRAAAGPRGANKKESDAPVSSQNHTFDFDGVFWSVPPNQVLTEQEAQDEYYLNALPPFADQEKLFKDVGVSAVDSLLKGYPVTVFAYGQTGSGKSHTIFGPMTDPGLSPRMAMEMFKIIEAEKQFGWKVEVALSCFEIYNEKVTDLLSKSIKPSPKANRTPRGRSFSAGPARGEADTDVLTPSRLGGPRTPNKASGGGILSGADIGGEDAIGVDDEESIDQSSNADAASLAHDTNTLYGGQSSVFGSPSRANFEMDSAPKELKVRQHPDLGVFVEGLRKEQVGDAYQLTGAIQTALNHRVTAATRMNDTSSRSHAVIQVSVDIRDEVQGKRRSAIMNIIDLAGSERISRSGVTGQQLNEAKNINLSLTTLRRVIDVITENMDKKKQKQVPPFRESTLTWILMDCFGGSSVTIMLATVSPHLDNIGDSLSTMRYATKCKTIVNQVKANESKIAITIAAINAESERLRRNLKEAEGDKNDYETIMKQEKAKLQRKTNVLKAVIKPTHDRMKLGRDEAEKKLQEVELQLQECAVKLQSQHTKASCDEEVALIAQKNTHAKLSMEQEYKQFRRVEEESAHLKNEINNLLGIEPSTQSSAFKAMRRTAIRRQIIMYAQEQRDKPIMKKLREDNVLLENRIEMTRDALNALDQLIADERVQVDIAGEPERIKDALAAQLSDAHEQISQSIEGFRNDTGAFNKQSNAIQKEIHQLEVARLGCVKELEEWEAFHEELKLQLIASTRQVTIDIKDLAKELEDQLSDLGDVRKRRVDASDGCVMVEEAVRLEKARAAAQQEQLQVLRSHVSASVTQLRNDDEARSDLQQAASEAQVGGYQLQKECDALQTAIEGLESVIRARCFPDATPFYGDHVLARMAVDLDIAAAVSPKQLSRMQRRQLDTASSCSSSMSPSHSHERSPSRYIDPHEM